MMRAGSQRLIGLLIAVLGFAPAATALEPLDLAVKATYLYKLAPFVDWPQGAFAAPDSPFDLCVIGDDPFGPILDRAVAGQHVGAHPIVVHRLPTVAGRSGCELAFVAGSKAQPVKDALRQLSGSSVLTVTDNQPSRGIVDFIMEDGRVRFRIDDQAATENGLTISSKLLSLAISVVPKRARTP